MVVTSTECRAADSRNFSVSPSLSAEDSEASIQMTSEPSEKSFSTLSTTSVERTGEAYRSSSRPKKQGEIKLEKVNIAKL